MGIATRRHVARILSIGWGIVWLAPLTLFALNQGFCAECSCCADLFGGRVACVRGLEPSPGVEMTCDDARNDEIPGVPPLLGKVRPGTLLAAVGAAPETGVAAPPCANAQATNRDASPPEPPPPRA